MCTNKHVDPALNPVGSGPAFRQPRRFKLVHFNSIHLWLEILFPCPYHTVYIVSSSLFFQNDSTNAGCE